MPRQVDCSRSNMDVHEIVDNPALNVTLVFVNQNLWNSQLTSEFRDLIRKNKCTYVFNLMRPHVPIKPSVGASLG